MSRPVFIGATMVLLKLLMVLTPVGWLITLWVSGRVKWDTDHQVYADPSGKTPETLGVLRGDLPRWLRWFGTPDERAPGGMYEAKVWNIAKDHGERLCFWYWIGVRNVLHGLAAAWGVVPHEVAKYGHFPETDGRHVIKREDGTEVWQVRKQLGKFVHVRGYRIYMNNTAVPVCTIKRA